jgi:hypothetical protein
MLSNIIYMNNKSTEYKCKICNKHYKTYQTLWKHNKKFHDKPIILCSENIRNYSEINTKEYSCRKCNKIFYNVKTRWSHEKKCTETKSTEDKKLELELLKEKNKHIQLQLKLKKVDATEGVTVRKLNKMLAKYNNIKNSNIHSNNTNTTNNVNNHYTFNLVGFGKEENVLEILSKQDKKNILNAKYGSLEKFIEIIHCGEYDQFKNLLLTNSKDNFMYKYDQEKNMFVLANKDDILDALVQYRINDLEELYNDLLEKKKVDNKTQECITKMIDKINDLDTKHVDYNGKEHDNYKDYKKNEIKLLLFNNQDKITNDLMSNLNNDL